MRISGSTPQISQPAATRAANPASAQPSAPTDTVVSAPSHDSGVYAPTHAPRSNQGTKMALQMAGIGVSIGGILACTNLPAGWVGPGIIVSMCGGLGLMALANNN